MAKPRKKKTAKRRLKAARPKSAARDFVVVSNKRYAVSNGRLALPLREESARP
jgi:hypothetical protein